MLFGEEGVEESTVDLYYNVNQSITRAVELNIPMILSTKETNIIVPCEILEYFNNNYFLEHIENNNCRLEQDNSMEFFKCRESTIELLEYVHFVFGEIDIVIPAKRLFNEEGNFAIMCYNNDTSNEFILGYQFLMNYFMIFDYDDDAVSFFSLLGKKKLNSFEYKNKLNLNDKYHFGETITINAPKSNGKIPLIVIVITILILLSGIVCCMLSYKYI